MRWILALAGVAAVVWTHAAADELIMPADVAERDRPVTAIYRLARPATGKGTLHVEWTDAAGRLVERGLLPVDLTRAAEIAVPLDPRRAVVSRNLLRARLSLDGVDADGAPLPRTASASTTFAVAPPGDTWGDYQIILWHKREPERYPALKRLGVTAGMVFGNREVGPWIDPSVEPFLRHDLRWYVENIATDLYSSYHRWTPGRAVNWRFIEAQRRLHDNPGDLAAFQREPSLSDPVWLKRIGERLRRTVAAHRPYRPLYYSLGDETGIADLAAHWDFDLSPPALDAMRNWLRAQYADLDALNRQWGTAFAAWADVMPMLTAEAMRRTDDNFSAWADFKSFMDDAFAQALRAGTDAVRAADPDALAAIEGAQIPGWGGYDYARLATAVDLIEMANMRDNLDLARSFNPGLVTIGILGNGGGPPAMHGVWRDLLRGNRGLVLWDEADGFVQPDGGLGPDGRAAAETFAAIRGGLGALLIAAERQTDPVAIFHSPASFRTQWLLDWRGRGDAWSRRSAADEYAPDPVREAPTHYARMIRRAGLQHRHVAAAQLAQDGLQRDGVRALVLSNAIALSPQEADAIRAFVAAGGTAIADAMPGTFDQHSRRLPAPRLADLFDDAPSDRRIGQGRAIRLAGAPGTVAPGRIAEILAEAGVAPALRVRRPDGGPPDDVEVTRFRHGATTIVAVQRGQPAAEAAKPEPVQLVLPEQAHLHDPRTGRALGQRDVVALLLEPHAPTFVVASPMPMRAPRVVVTPGLRPGQTAELRLSGSGALRVEIRDPLGNAVPHYGETLVARDGAATKLLPFALNDPPGVWTVRVTEALSGLEASTPIVLARP